MSKNIQNVTDFELAILAPAEGNSAIVEVTDLNGSDILHVIALADGDYELKFIGATDSLIFRYSDIEKIVQYARRNVEYFDPEAEIPE